MTRNALAILTVCVLAIASGCHAIDFYTPSLQKPVPPELEPPRELSMVSLPAYRISPPDVLGLSVVKLVPRPSYRIGRDDVLKISALGTLPKQPIQGFFTVENEGVVTLGAQYGVFRVLGLTVEEAEAEITRFLRLLLQNPVVTVQLSRSADVEQLSGRYEVGPDGVINLRNYGMVNVAGKTVTEAREAVLARLAQYFDSPQLGIEVLEYNSDAYYVVTEAIWKGNNLQRLPITGNETVLDAVGKVQALWNVKIARKTMWIARPTPGDCAQLQILPIDWNSITHGRTECNYQLMPGDRLFIVDENLVVADHFIRTFTTPINRLLGISSLGASTTRAAETTGRDYNSNRGL